MEQPFMGHTPSSFERNLQRIPRDLRGIGGGTVLNATFSERADVPAGIVRPAQAHAPDPPLVCGGISERSGTAVKGLTAPARAAITEIRG